MIPKCKWCCSPSVPGHTLCEVHLRLKREQSKASERRIHHRQPSTKLCGICRQLGHDVRTCPSLFDDFQ